MCACAGIPGFSLLAPAIARRAHSPTPQQQDLRGPAQTPTGSHQNRPEAFNGTNASHNGTLSCQRAACEGVLTASKTILRPLPPPSPHLAMGNGDLWDQLTSARARIAELEHGQRSMVEVLNAVTSHLDLKSEDLAAISTQSRERSERVTRVADDEDRSLSPGPRSPKILRRTNSATRGW